MEQIKQAVLGLSEGMEQGGEAPAVRRCGEVAGAEGSTEPERVSEVDNPVRGVAFVSVKNEDLEEPWPESDGVAAAGNVSGRGAASSVIKKEDREALKYPIATHFEFRAAAANATPPSTIRRVSSKSRKQSGPTKFIAAGDAESSGSKTPDLGASSSAPETGPPEDVSAVADGAQGAAPGNDKKGEKACFVPRARVAIAHATPPDSYRFRPSRSRKQSSPTRFIAAGAPPSTGAQAASDPPPPASQGSTLPSGSASGLHTATRSALDATASTASSDMNDAPAFSYSYRGPSRGRKQRRPEHFIPEEAEATASAKARRSNIVLDRFLSSLVHGSSAPWVKNATADGVHGQHKPQPVTEGFRIRDVSSHHAARICRLRAAISRLGATDDPSSSATALGCPPGEPDDGSGRIYGVLAVLGASLVLSVVSCVLFYIVGRRSEPGPSGEQESDS